MKKTLDIFSILLVWVFGQNPQFLHAQAGTYYSGINNNPVAPLIHSGQGKKLFNGNHSLGSIFDSTLCGLNFVQATAVTETRGCKYNIPEFCGVGLPCSLSITGLPASACSRILKAYAFYNVSYTEASPPASTITITNPASIPSTFNVTLSGIDGPVGWKETGVALYCADVTSSISGNGTYTANVSGFANAAGEVDGVSLFIIYIDKYAAYNGSLVLFDGEISALVGSLTDTLRGFNVCDSASNAEAFASVSDIQIFANAQQNVTQNFNGTVGSFPDEFFLFTQLNTSLAKGQNSSVYKVYTNNMDGDCFSWFLAGLYWQNTTCLTCPNPNLYNYTLTSTFSPCNKDSGTAKVHVGVPGAFTYLWSTGSTADSIYNVGPGIYTVTITGPGGCSSSPTITVPKEDSLSVMLQIAQRVSCYGDSNGVIIPVIKPGKIPYSYSWSNNATTATLSGLKAGTYTCTIKDEKGCDCSASVTLTQPPALPVIKATPAKDSICIGKSIALNAGGGRTYSWIPATGLSCNNCSSPTASPTITVTYTVTGFDSTGCSNTAKVSIKVKPLPKPVITGNDTVCKKTPITLTASGGTNYVWVPDSLKGSSVTVRPTSTITYTVIANLSGCVYDTTFTIIVNPLPAISINGNIAGACYGLADTINLSGGNYTYKWNNGNTKNQYILNSVRGDSTLSVQVFNGTCYYDTSFKVAVKKPPVSFINPAHNCKGECTNLSAFANQTGLQFNWSNGTTGDTIIICPDTLTAYTVTVSNGCPIQVKDSTVVPVYLHSLNACCDTTIDRGDTIIVSASKETTYQWLPATGLNCNKCQSVKATPTVTTTYTLTGTDANGCSDTREITIKVEVICTELHVPNVFTPDNNGINDLFEIRIKNIDSYNIVIYDRWGKEMYNSANPNQYWNGNTKSGAKAADGIYYYVITYICQGRNYTKNGFVQLIR